MDAGARTGVRPLTDRDLWICNQIGPVLRDKGLLFTGIDVIGEFMTELNVTSPTGIREMERASDVRITGKLEKRLGVNPFKFVWCFLEGLSRHF